MLTLKQAEEILQALSQLPPEKVSEAQDFIRKKYEFGYS